MNWALQKSNVSLFILSSLSSCVRCAAKLLGELSQVLIITSLSFSFLIHKMGIISTSPGCIRDFLHIDTKLGKTV